MKLINRLVIILLFGFSFFSTHIAHARSEYPSKIVLGFIPGEDREVLKKNGAALADVLKQKLNVPVEVLVPDDYNGLVQSMKDGKVDFAFFTALTFVEAEQKAGAKVLLKKVWETPFYYSSIVTLDNSKIRKITDLKGKKFGFVDEKSASGYLYPKAMFLKKKINIDKLFAERKFYGNHEAAVKALKAGEVDAVAVYADDEKGKGGAWTAYTPGTKVRALWVSDPIPNDPFCVRKDFYDKYPRYTHDLMFALIDLQDEPADKNPLKLLFNVKSMALATSKQYDPVRELMKYIREP
jgi:phosphonate transport system substrate-binding protein